MNRVKELVGAKEVYQRGYTGKNVNIALLDTGVCAAHPDLNGRIALFIDFIGEKNEAYDDNGHGTHIAGILCGSGKQSGGRISGMAPKAGLVVMKVLDKDGNGDTQIVLKALEWLKKNHRRYRIKILNFSVGFLPGARKKEQEQLLCAIDDLWDDGVLVVAAAGNNGPRRQSITVPGISRKVITVGASDDFLYRHRELHPGYSGKGPTGCCIVKPEILAPGTRIMSLSNDGTGYTQKSGTSMAAPVVCGAMALAFEKNPLITPAGLKLCLYQTVKPLPQEGPKKSWGILQVDALMRML